MTKPWYLRNPAYFEETQRQVNREYTSLIFTIEQGTVFLRGVFPLRFGDQDIDHFGIEVQIPDRFPDEIPIVREVGGRIPRIIDRHVITADGQLCLFVREERWRLYPQGSTLLDFLKGPVHSHLLGQAMVELGAGWPFGERSHGLKGVLEHYEELIGTNDLSVIKRYMLILSKKSVGGHLPCPCGSGKKIRDCHLELITSLRERIPPRMATSALVALMQQEQATALQIQRVLSCVGRQVSVNDICVHKGS
jgi:hypothetical protein